MNKWSSINQFRHVVAYVKSKSEYGGVTPPTLLFRGSVKLHGTNAGIRREQGKFIPQGRNNELTLDADNAGFANWLHNKLLNPIFEKNLHNTFDVVSNKKEDVVTIYGEWCGKGIQKGVGVTQLSKRFVIFGAKIGEENILNNQSITIQDDTDIDNILLYPIYFISINFNDSEQLKQSVTEMEQLTSQVESQCPYAIKHGVDGIGEGIVWICMDSPSDTALWFKTKGDKHTGTATEKKTVTIEPEVLEKISDVIDYVLTAGRLQQGLEQLDSLDMKQLGQYLKWIGQDIQKEELDTIEANGLEWKQIAKGINAKAKNFFIQQLDSKIGL
jgi:hypothetical protein